MRKEELETTIVEKLRSVERKISELYEEKKSIVSELVSHYCPFKVGDYVSVTRKRNDEKTVVYGVIKSIKYDCEQKKFLYSIYYVDKHTKVCNGGQIYCGNSAVIEKYD
jgi:hypothetical protein